MRRILLPLIAVAAAYCAYLTTLPAPVSRAASAVMDNSPRMTREITIPARSLYAACLGEYEEEATARVEAARLTARGAAGCVRESGDGYAVLGAIYETQGDAGSVCRRISREEGMDARVIHYPADALRLRVTAGEGQLMAMESAISMLESVPGELNALSYQLDGGELTGDTARALIAVMHTEAGAVNANLTVAAQGTEDRFCLSLCKLTEELCRALESMCAPGGPGGLALSSAMKNAAMGAQLGMTDMMNELR